MSQTASASGVAGLTTSGSRIMMSATAIASIRPRASPG